MINRKLVLVLLISISSLMVTNSYCQDLELDQISKIIRSGNAKDLVKQFSTTVELNLDGEEASYSKAQAEAVLKDFFDKLPPEAFKVNHKGSSKSGLSYAIGEYSNTSGSYRVWIRLKSEGGKNLVYEMSFIKD
jgi:hypothetical protein